MLKLPNRELYQAALNRPRRIVESSHDDKRSPNDNAIAHTYYKPGPEDDDCIPPYKAMQAFNKQQRREFLQSNGRAKLSIEKREPVRRMSKFDEIHSTRQSYFSEELAKGHKMHEQQFKLFYHPHYGCYRYSNGKKLCSVFQKPEMLGVSSVAISRDGRDVVVGYGNGDFKLWDRENQVVLSVEPYERRGRITRIKFFGDPYLKFLASNRGGEIYLFKLRGLKPPPKDILDEPSIEPLLRRRKSSFAYARSLRMASRYQDLLTQTSAERDKRLAAESEIVDRELEYQMRSKPYPYAVATWECYRFNTEKNNEIEALDIDPTETKVITAGQDASIRLYDLKTRKIVTTYYGYNKDCHKTYVRPWATGTMGGEGHYLRVYAAKFCQSRPNVFVTGGLDSVLKLWDVRCESSCRNIVGPLVYGDTIDSVENTIAVGQWTKEGSIMLIDMRTDNYRVLKPINRWHGGGFPYCLKYFKDVTESTVSNDLLLVGGSGYLEIVSISEDEILAGFPDSGNIATIDNNKNLIVTGSSEHSFNLHEYFPDVFYDESEEFPMESPSETRGEMTQPTLNLDVEVPHARVKDIKKIKRAKAPQDTLVRQIKKLMIKSCRKEEVPADEREKLNEIEDDELSESSLKNVPLTARKSLKVKSILIERIADKQMRKMIKKIRKKEMSRAEKREMKKELLRVQGHFQPNDESEESLVFL